MKNVRLVIEDVKKGTVVASGSIFGEYKLFLDGVLVIFNMLKEVGYKIASAHMAKTSSSLKTTKERNLGVELLPLLLKLLKS